MTPPRSPATKQDWRAHLLAARRAMDEPARFHARTQIAAHLRALTSGGPLTICAYLPLGSEPLDPDLPYQLVRDGHRVLVPLTTPGEVLDWAELRVRGEMAPGIFGIAEPTGPRLGPSVITAADLLLVPALAVDRQGTRLGRGGGFYDRSLALLPPTWSGRLIAVLFDGEFVAVLPADVHDISIGAVVTPTAGIVTINAFPG